MLNEQRQQTSQLSSQVRLLLSTQIQNSPLPPALARWMSSFSFWIRLSRESTTNKCRMNSRRRGSRGLRRASDEARFSGSFLSLQLPWPFPILISLSWSDLKLSREFSLQSMVYWRYSTESGSMVPTIFDKSRIDCSADWTQAKPH